jgi:hypothetical protein
MTAHIIVQYVGFQVKTSAREYGFNVREATGENVHYTLTISHEAFDSRRVRYQDAPEICSIRLHRELDTFANHPPTTSFCITDVELASYHDSHLPKNNPSLAKRRED